MDFYASWINQSSEVDFAEVLSMLSSNVVCAYSDKYKMVSTQLVCNNSLTLNFVQQKR